jgi:predicted phosphodiesterase
MKRRGFLVKSLGGMAGTGVALSRGQETASPAAGPLIRTPLNLMAPREDGVFGIWAVSGLCRGWLEWREAGGDRGKAAMTDSGFVPQSPEIFRINLTGLKAGREYEVKAVVESADDGRKEETPWKKFRTLDSAAASTRFVVWNDTHERNETITKLDDATPAADFLIWNGDTCNDWKTEEILIPTLLHPAGRDITKGHPMILVPGNHDVRGKFGYRVPQMIGMTDERPYCAFRSGPVAVICLHTGEDKPDGHPSFNGRVAFDELRKVQTAWLEKVIRSNGFRDAKYRVVFCHIPLRWLEEPETVDYANGGFDRYSKRSRDAWHDLLVEWKAQVIISGHTHNAQYLTATEKSPYAQLVGGGPQLERARWIEGVADAAALKLTVRDLSGTVTHEAEFKAL